MADRGDDSPDAGGASGFMLADDAATARLGAAVASVLADRAFLALRGPLGAGKTALARALIGHRFALAGEEAGAIPSPTFTLVNHYEPGGLVIRHFDLYRLEDADEVWEIGWEDALGEGVTLVEWPERAEALLPPDRLEVRLSPCDGGRRAELRATGPRHAVMLEALDAERRRQGQS